MIGKDNYTAGGSFNNTILGRENHADYGATDSILVGRYNVAQNSVQSSVAIGNSNKTTGNYSSALGDNNIAEGINASAVGSSNTASAERTTAVGYSNTASAEQTTAVGYSNEASGSFASAIGYDNTASYSMASAIGYENHAIQSFASAIGYENEATGSFSSAVGSENKAQDTYASALGDHNTANGMASSAIGYYNTASYSNTVSMGSRNEAKYGDGNTAVGYNNTASGLNEGSIVAGSSAVGYNNTSSALGSSAFGYENKVQMKQSTAVGYKNVANGYESFVAGSNAVTQKDYSIALGSGSFANREYGKVGYDILGDNHDDDTTGTWKAKTAALSIGNVTYDENGSPSYQKLNQYGIITTSTKSDDAITRQITGVAAGTYDTDAVNVAQLKQLISPVHIYNGGNIFSPTYSGGTEVTQDMNNTNIRIAFGRGLQAAYSKDEQDNEVIQVGLDDDSLKGIGPAGKDGKDGKDGVNGADGKDGEKGDKGDKGDTGENGKNSTATVVNNQDGTTTITTTYYNENNELVTNSVTINNNPTEKAGPFGLADEKTGTVTQDLGTNISIIGDGTRNYKDGKLESVTDSNITTKVVPLNPDDPTGQQAVKVALSDQINLGGHDDAPKDGKVAVNGKDGKSNGATMYAETGANGVDGHIGLKGHDGLDGKDGSAGVSADIRVAKGQDGVNGKDGSAGTTRIVYNDGEDGKSGKDYELATTEDGLKFTGNNRDTINHNKLNTTVNVVGEGTGKDLSRFNSAAGNIAVEANGKDDNDSTLTIKLNKDLTNLNSVTTNNAYIGGNTTINNNGITTNKVVVGNTTVNNNGITINNGPTITQTNVDMGGNQIHHVQAGKDDTDAVNVSQLNQVKNDQQNIYNKIDRLDDDIDRVGAGAAALAALHPLDFDADEKLDFSTGVGHYRGQNAVAVGAFYRPSEDTMISVAGTVGNGSPMMNIGFSWKFGQHNHVSKNTVAMAKEIVELRKENEQFRSFIADGLSGMELDLSKIQLFPDIPKNHWAYDYVATLAGNGILEGYPDGYFDGNRVMSRYEMAAVLYRAMLKGVQLKEQALREFGPELQRIRVDTISRHEDGSPSIQRVRVIKGRD